MLTVHLRQIFQSRNFLWLSTPEQLWYGHDNNSNNLTNYPLSDLYLAVVTVTVSCIYDNNNTWNQGFYDGYTPTISAENDGVVWEAQTTPEGF